MLEEPTVSVQPIIGLCLIGLSFLCQVGALFLMRVLHRLGYGGYTVVLRMWLYLACGLDQISFFVFHIKYHVLATDFKDPDTCIVLRFCISCTSTFTMMWLFVISVFYFVLTVKPTRCFSFHGRVLAYCITYMWTCVSCLMYLILAFFLRREQHRSYIYPCWHNINDTIHLYLTFGNELIVFFCIICLAIFTRVRLTYSHRQVENFSQRPFLKEEFLNLSHKVNILLLIITFICLYYIFLLTRLVMLDIGSDLSIMIVHSMKGIAIVATTCFLDKHVLDLIRCRLDTNHGNHFVVGRFPDSDRHLEMNTFVFD